MRIGLHGGLALCLLAVAALAAPLPGQRVERFTLAGPSAAVHNLAGEVTVLPGTGTAVVVEVTRGGEDAGQLRLVRRGGTLAVVYPGTRIVYPRMEARSRTMLQVRRDGSLGRAILGSRRVAVSAAGPGTRAWADVRVLVPPGRAVAVHQGAGLVRVNNVRGNVDVLTVGANVRTQGTRGALDVGVVHSGAVDVRDAQGDVTVGTGSGSVTLRDVRGARLKVSTGSGRVSGAGVRMQSVAVDVGSGGVNLTGVAAREVAVESGSGAVHLGLATDADLDVETGSGGVTVEVPGTFGARLEISTGSGGITVDLAVADRRSSRGSFTGTVGDGRGRARIETGSGAVRIRRG